MSAKARPFARPLRSRRHGPTTTTQSATAKIDPPTGETENPPEVAPRWAVPESALPAASAVDSTVRPAVAARACCRHRPPPVRSPVYPPLGRTSLRPMRLKFQAFVKFSPRMPRLGVPWDRFARHREPDDDVCVCTHPGRGAVTAPRRVSRPATSAAEDTGSYFGSA
jgi:hypothetical protein